MLSRVQSLGTSGLLIILFLLFFFFSFLEFGVRYTLLTKLASTILGMQFLNP